MFTWRTPAHPTYMTIMYDGHYAPSTTWVVHGTDSLLPADYTPPPHAPGPGTHTRVDWPDGPHIQGTWEHASLETLLDVWVDVLEAALGGHAVGPCLLFPLHVSLWGGVGWGQGHDGVAVAGAARRGHPLWLGAPDSASNDSPPPTLRMCCL